MKAYLKIFVQPHLKEDDVDGCKNIKVSNQVV